MYLKSLELHGFKSFPEKTVLNFNAGATVIVGPNGSGKSNITDAMRWVLGELSSKNIRGSKMEDVIFVGADGRRPMNFAEVSVTFDDSKEPRRLSSPYTEVTVTRRYYRSGDSEYYINRRPVRLKDINELFMNTGIGRDGYSIIGQGRIAEIISKKNEDRRNIFEETAGISKYRYKKQESERRLAETEDNMIRIRDILTELESRVGPMEKAAGKARRYMELFAVKKEADVSLWLWDMAGKRRDIASIEESLALSSHELEMMEDTEGQLVAAGERLFAASEDNKAEESKLYGEIRSKRDELHRIESEYKLLENNAEHQIQTADRDSENAGIFEKNAEAERAESEKFSRARADAEEKLADAEISLSGVSEKKEIVRQKKVGIESQLEALLGEQRELESKKADIDVRLGVLESSVAEQKSRSGSVKAEIEKYEKEIAELTAARDRADRGVAEYGAEIEAAERLLAEKKNEIADLDAEMDRIGKLVSAASSECEERRSRIEALRRIEAHYEGYQQSVRYVMEQSGKTLRGIRGPISKLIRIFPEHATAIEIALGAGLQNIVVDDESAAKAAISALKQAGAGRATFCPLTSVKGQPRSRELEAASGAPGFVGFADELVRCDDEYRGVVSFQLGRTAVFKDIDTASRAAKQSGWRIRAITLDGQQINAGGSFTGGSVKQGSGILTRSGQIESLEGELAVSEKKLGAVREELSKIRKKRESVASDAAGTDDRCALLRTMLRSEQGALDEASAKCDAMSSLIERLKRDADDLGESKRKRDEEREELNFLGGESAKKISQINEQRMSLDGDRYDCEAEMEELTERYNSLMILIAELKRDIESAEISYEDCISRADEADKKSKEYTESANTHRSEAEAAIKLSEEYKVRCEEIAGEIESLEEKRAGLEAGGLDYEKKIKELQAKERELLSKKELVYRAHTKSENRRDQLSSEIDRMTSRLWDEYELTAASAAELGYNEVSEASRPAVQKTLDETKEAIRALGSVNLDAIEEYAELKERYDSVSVQMDDLEASKVELSGIISSIEEEMRRMFTEAFDKVNRNFGQVFRELFGGGSAELSLTDPEDVLNCGIEISAAPPGKMIKNLSLLSGGEQAFIAIALLFALIRVNPSPFCIFDEIEAALDEVNVARAAKYMRRVSKELQVIMITHRRGTMEIADTMYGVTMPNHGISKVFTLDVESVAGDFAAEHLGS